MRIYAGGKSGLAKEFLPPGRGRKFYPDAIYHATERLKVNFIAVREGEAGWLLVTSLSDFPHAIKLYRQRMQIEQTFRDLKSLLGLSRVRVRGVFTVQVLLVLLICTRPAAQTRRPAIDGLPFWV